MNPGYFLAELNGKTISEIFRVSIDEQTEYSWLIFIAFSDLERFLKIEGDIDGDHIKIGLEPLSSLPEKLWMYEQFDYEGNLLWEPNKVDKAELLGTLLGKKLSKIEYGVDKHEFVVNGNLLKGERDLFTFIRFHLDDLILTIQEGGSGLYISTEFILGHPFEYTFDWYSTK
jgi:hypothetical protein